MVWKKATVRRSLLVRVDRPRVIRDNLWVALAPRRAILLSRRTVLPTRVEPRSRLASLMPTPRISRVAARTSGSSPPSTVLVWPMSVTFARVRLPTPVAMPWARLVSPSTLAVTIEKLPPIDLIPIDLTSVPRVSRPARRVTLLMTETCLTTIPTIRTILSTVRWALLVLRAVRRVTVLALRVRRVPLWKPVNTCLTD